MKRRGETSRFIRGGSSDFCPGHSQPGAYSHRGTFKRGILSPGVHSKRGILANYLPTPGK